MAPVHYSAKARADMLEIWLWIATRSGASIADDIIDRIEQRITRLTRHPELGRMRPEIAQGARSLVVERWLVLYEIGPKNIHIFRVIDGAKDLRRLRSKQ